ncbi:hypothetical protein ACN47E_004649 [Coniothyrium glycines]
MIESQVPYEFRKLLNGKVSSSSRTSAGVRTSTSVQTSKDTPPVVSFEPQPSPSTTSAQTTVTPNPEPGNPTATTDEGITIIASEGSEMSTTTASQTIILIDGPSDLSPSTDSAQETTIHVHTTITAASPSSTSTHEPSHHSEPVLSAPAIAGTAAGGTAFLALGFGLTYFLMRRRNRKFRTPTSGIWSPDHNHDDHRKPRMMSDNTDPYSAVGTPRKLELPGTGQAAYSANKPGLSGGGERWDAPPAPRSFYHDGEISIDGMTHNNSTSKEAMQANSIPEMGTTTSPSPSIVWQSPVSDISTAVPWHMQASKSLHDTRSMGSMSDSITSPVSELRASTPMPRVVELDGDSISSPIAELDTSASRISSPGVEPQSHGHGGMASVTGRRLSGVAMNHAETMEPGPRQVRKHDGDLSVNF